MRLLQGKAMHRNLKWSNGTAALLVMFLQVARASAATYTTIGNVFGLGRLGMFFWLLPFVIEIAFKLSNPLTKPRDFIFQLLLCVSHIYH